MKAELNEITCRDGKTLAKLYEYCGKLMGYSFFDPNMVVRVFVDDEKDFCAFESVTYRVQFTSNAKKLTTIAKSSYDPTICMFSEFRDHIGNLFD